MSRDDKQVFSIARDRKVATWDCLTDKMLWGAGKDLKKYCWMMACWSNDRTRMLPWIRASIVLLEGNSGDKFWDRITHSMIMCIAWDKWEMRCGVQRRNRTSRIGEPRLAAGILMRPPQRGEILKPTFCLVDMKDSVGVSETGWGRGGINLVW